MTVNTTTGLPAPDELAEALDHLGTATGYPLFGSRLALARGDVATAYAGYLRHRRLVRERHIPRLTDAPEDRDGISPAELLRRAAELPARPDDTKRGPR